MEGVFNMVFWQNVGQNRVCFGCCAAYYNRRNTQTNRMFAPIQQFRQHYEMAEEIGRGAFAICYRATHRATQTVVAAKKINILAEDEPATQSISNEVSLLNSLSHQNIIKFIKAYRSKKYAIILTEFQQGRDLQQKIGEMKRANRRFTQKQIYSIFGQLLQGLAYLHEHNIIHRDIKPSNIFIDGNQQVKIGDLGASTIVQELNFTRIGTPYYLPPEIIRHEHYSFSADIWSLGVTLYHLVYLQLPFKASNVIKLGQLIVESQPNYQPKTCEWVEKAIRSMLMKDEKRRPTAKQLIEEYFQKERVIIQLGGSESEQVLKLQVKEEELAQSLVVVQQEKSQKRESRYEQIETTFKEISIRRSLLQNTHKTQSVFTDNYAMPTPSTLRKRTTKTDHHHRFLEKKYSHIGKDIIDQNESTIVLSVNNPIESRQESLITPAYTHKKTYFLNESICESKHCKKSSGFRQTLRPQGQSTSHFFEQKPAEKERLSFVGHKREPSAIQQKLKHSELMQKIKPLKVQTVWRESEGEEGQIQSKVKVRVTVDSPSFVLLR